MIGQIIDGFRIDHLIAQGGMAEVYEATQESLSRKVAIKVMLAGFAHQEELVSRFQREGQAAARLNHPNIIQVFAIGLTHDGRPYLAMEFCPRGSLEVWLDQLSGQEQPAPVDQALKIARKMALALDVAHKAGIVHRDLKPSNILFREDGSPVLADLGIAAVRSAARLTQTGAILGTPHYMSPEQAKGTSVDGRSDIYSLGIILYEMLAGHRPFEAEDTPAILHEQVYERPDPLKGVHPGLSARTYAVVERCLQKETNDRYQTAGELESDLLEALTAEGVTPTPPKPMKPLRNQPWWLAIIVIILIAVLFFIFGPDNGPSRPEESSSAGESAIVETVFATQKQALGSKPTSTVAPEPTTNLPKPVETAQGGQSQNTPTLPIVPSEAPLQLRTLMFEVKANQGRNYTGLQLSPGQSVKIIFLSGTWRAGALPTWPLVGPEGDPQVSSKGTFPVQDEPLMTLIGGIGDQEVFFIGNSSKHISNHDGPLWLGANDDNFSDNGGAIDVSIIISN